MGCWNWYCGFICRDWPQQGHPETSPWLNRVSEYSLYNYVNTFMFCTCDVYVYFSPEMCLEKLWDNNFQIEKNISDIDVWWLAYARGYCFPLLPHHSACVVCVKQDYCSFIVRLEFSECGVIYFDWCSLYHSTARSNVQDQNSSFWHKINETDREVQLDALRRHESVSEGLKTEPLLVNSQSMWPVRFSVSAHGWNY